MTGDWLNGKPETMNIKICGLTRSEQVQAIAALRPQYLGFICVPQSPRFVAPERLCHLTQDLPPEVLPVGVFANADLETLTATVEQGGLRGIQLHGAESPDFCQAVRQRFPQAYLIRALRIRTAADLAHAQTYGTQAPDAAPAARPDRPLSDRPLLDRPLSDRPLVDALLLDAYHPQQLGGTGETLDWPMLRQFQPPIPWFLAGGLRPDNVAEALALVSAQGVDVSSGVERSPGDKDLDRVAAFIAAVRQHTPPLSGS